MKFPSFLLTAAFCGLSLPILDGCSKSAPSSSSAGASPTPGGFVSQSEAREQRLKTELGLSDDQIAKLHAIMEEGRPAREALRDDTSLTDEQRRAKFQEMRQEADAKIQAVLTPDQFAKWQEMRRNFGGQGRGNRQNGQNGQNGGGDQPQQAPAAQ
jgi:periplasmic protein CpxP/Spy